MRKKLHVMAAGLLAMAGVAHATDTFNTANNELTIPSVQVGNTVYNDVVLHLNPGGFSVLSVGTSQPVGSVSATCSLSNFTTASYNAIQAGMTVAQVNQAMGCQYDPAETRRGSGYMIYIWSAGVTSGTGTYIMVWFDPTGSTVTTYGSGFKSSVGF